jgi:hypothetical protein
LAAALRPPPSTLRWARQQHTPPGVCLSATRWDTGQKKKKKCPSPHLPPGPCSQSGQNGHWRVGCPLCLHKVGPIPTRQKASWTSWARWQKTDTAWDLSPLQDHFGGAQGNHPSSRWASITYSVLPDFLGKLYPSQISMVGMDGLIHQPKVTGPLSCHILGFPFTYSFLILPSCPTCAQVSPQGGLKPPPTFSAHQLWGSIPREDWQVDFTHTWLNSTFCPTKGCQSSTFLTCKYSESLLGQL